MNKKEIHISRLDVYPHCCIQESQMDAPLKSCLWGGGMPSDNHTSRHHYTKDLEGGKANIEK